MTDRGVFEPPERIRSAAHINSLEQYHTMYRESIDQPEKFWGKYAERFYWKEPPPADRILQYNMDIRRGPISIKWFDGGKTNICYNALDRNIEKGLGDKVAFHWAGNDASEASAITYSEMLRSVCRFAHVLRVKFGVKEGDRVAIYMPMVAELAIAMLACARIGAVHSIVFGGFSAQSLADRILDARCQVVITADGVWRGTKLVELKHTVEEALHICENQKAQHEAHRVAHVIVVRNLLVDPAASPADKRPEKAGARPVRKMDCPWTPERDHWWEELMREFAAPKFEQLDPVWLDAEAPLFILYTSGSTGRPKGIVHTVGGYMVYTAITFLYVFDYHEDDPTEVFWCTADIGWITGHSYVVYGPMLNGATGVIFEGVPYHPDASRYWQIVDQFKVTKFYTAPTALRTLMKYGEKFIKCTDLSSLKILGTVGEPINFTAWLWYFEEIGKKQCSIVDTYWQTETGGHIITPLPGCTPQKPGSATYPFFGVDPMIVRRDGTELAVGMKEPSRESPQPPANKRTAVSDGDEQRPTASGEGAGAGSGNGNGNGNGGEEEVGADNATEGYLVLKKPWPGMARTIYLNHARFEEVYFKKFPGNYMTGDSAWVDPEGYCWVTGRIDDMLNVSGHLLSTAEIESALNEHKFIAESAVVPRSHPVKGECLYCFVTLKDGFSSSSHELDEKLLKELKEFCRNKIGPFATPDFIQEAPALPKTRSGKIMRRILKLIAAGHTDHFGDLTTLADESVIQALIARRPHAILQLEADEKKLSKQ